MERAGTLEKAMIGKDGKKEKKKKSSSKVHRLSYRRNWCNVGRLEESDKRQVITEKIYLCG